MDFSSRQNFPSAALSAIIAFPQKIPMPDSPPDSPRDSAPPSAGNSAAKGADAAARPPVFRLENMLVKNISLEVPERVDAPSFRGEPAVRLEMRNHSRVFPRPNCHEVSLEATARISDGDHTQLLVEVAQAGVFFLEGETPRQRETLLNVHAPEMLYPYVSQLLSDLAARAGAPRFYLPPFNFRALYEQKLRAIEKRQAEEAGENKTRQ